MSRGQPNPVDGYRVVQFSPPDSPASIIFGQGTTTMAVGSMQEIAQRLQGRE
jgi:hypothetical protein